MNIVIESLKEIGKWKSHQNGNKWKKDVLMAKIPLVDW